MLKQRIFTGAGLTVGISLVLLLSGHWWFLKAVSMILSVMAAYELCRTAGYLEKKTRTYGLMAAAAILSICSNAKLAGPLFIVGMIVGVYLMKKIQTMKKIPAWMLVLVVSMVALSFGMMTDLRREENGFYLLVMTILIPVITDIGAYGFGRSLGRHKLAPIISPKKTWEGSIGGTLCTLAVLLGVAALLNANGLLQVQMPYLTAYLLIASCIAQFGDLTFSAIKRIAGIKDYGTLLPGHGGILDRFDSLIFVIPFTIFVNQYIGPILMAI